MPAVIAFASELSRLQPLIPSPEETRAAFLKNTAYGGGNWGAFVGPRPRITRTATLGTGWTTSAAWLYGWPDNDWTRQHLAYLKSRLAQDIGAALHEQSADWSNVSVINYDPAVHGSLQFWASGQAADTATERNATLTSPAEDKLGPTTDRSILGGIQGGARDATKMVMTYAMGGVALYGLFLAWPAISRSLRSV